MTQNRHGKHPLQSCMPYTDCVGCRLCPQRVDQPIHWLAAHITWSSRTSVFRWYCRTSCILLLQYNWSLYLPKMVLQGWVEWGHRWGKQKKWCNIKQSTGHQLGDLLKGEQNRSWWCTWTIITANHQVHPQLSTSNGHRSLCRYVRKWATWSEWSKMVSFLLR